jgi:SAM-dependent methyltransferase
MPPQVATKTELFKLFLSEQSDPEPFYEKLADRTLALLEVPIEGRRILDLGSGPGHYTAALERAGATVVAVDMNDDDITQVVAKGLPGITADGTRLPFPDASFDGVFTSNLVEHVPDAGALFDEIQRVLKVGGWAWVSWTNWYSPWGGHFITPFHYLGPKLGYRVHVKLRGEPPRNRVFDGLWPAHIGSTIRAAEQRPGLRIRSAVPRYYPSQRWIMKVPGLREVASWNCLLTIDRVADPASGGPSLDGHAD